MKHIIIILLLIQVSYLHGQEMYKEVKSLSKSIDYVSGETIQITGERTYINITVVDQPNVSAAIEIVAKYKEQEQAREDLEKVQIVFTKKGKTIYFSNSIQIGDIADKPKSNIKTYLNLSVPKYSTININNSFGDLVMDGPMDDVTIESQFSTIELSNYKGQLSLQSKYDECKITNCEGGFEIVSDKTDLVLNKVSGDMDLDANFGSLEIIYDNKPLTYSVNSKYTPISIYLQADLGIYHNYSCKNCKLITEYCDEPISKESTDNSDNIRIGVNKGSKSEIQGQSEDINVISINSQANNQ